MIPRLALTPGEPAGVGPDLLIQTVQQQQQAQLIAFADPHMLAERAQQLGLPLQILPLDMNAEPVPTAAGTITVAAVPTAETVVAGQLNQTMPPMYCRHWMPLLPAVNLATVRPW